MERTNIPLHGLTALAMGASAVMADDFKRLKGSQIQAKFTGMEMTDEVHWSDVYGRNGTLTTYEMGDKRQGKWWVRNESSVRIGATTESLLRSLDIRKKRGAQRRRIDDPAA